MRMLKAIFSLVLAAALALAASGCSLCPGCYVLNQGFKALTGSNLPCHGPSSPKKPAEPAAAGPQTTCPVMGRKIDRKLFVDHGGKRIYVCCEDCIAKVRQDPAKYARQLEEAGVVLEKAPAPRQ